MEIIINDVGQKKDTTLILLDPQFPQTDGGTDGICLTAFFANIAERSARRLNYFSKPQVHMSPYFSKSLIFLLKL